jgi:hypothetical protein
MSELMKRFEAWGSGAWARYEERPLFPVIFCSGIRGEETTLMDRRTASQFVVESGVTRRRYVVISLLGIQERDREQRHMPLAAITASGLQPRG